MIVSKNKQTTIQEETTQKAAPALTTEQELVAMNPIVEAYKAVRTILSDLNVDENDDTSAPLFRTIKFDNGQLSRIKNNTHNLEAGIAFPAVFIHYINVYYNIGQSRIGEGKGTMRIHYVLNTLNNSDDEVELEGMRVYNRVVKAIESRKGEFPALVTRFQLQYWDQPLSFDDALQPYWIDYQIWFNDYSGYRYKDYVEKTLVIPPFTNHSDQDPSSNPDGHENHKTPTYDEVSGYHLPINGRWEENDLPIKLG